MVLVTFKLPWVEEPMIASCDRKRVEPAPWGVVDSGLMDNSKKAGSWVAGSNGYVK
jgi:hypothetical protein